MVKRVMGIEPTCPAWKAGVLPLNYTRMSIGVTGFEPATSWSQTRRSSQAEPHPGVAFSVTQPLLYYRKHEMSTIFFKDNLSRFTVAFQSGGTVAYVQNSLVAAPAEDQRDILLGFHEFAVHQDIDVGEHFVRHLGVYFPALR